MKITKAKEIKFLLVATEIGITYFEPTEAWLKRIKKTCMFLQQIVKGNHGNQIKKYAFDLLKRYIAIWEENF